MKTGFSIILLLFCLSAVRGQEVVFLHHSTGYFLYDQGNVAGWINDYNLANQTDYQITERFYPDSPYPWANYAYDYWNLWINGVCDNSDPDIECLDRLCQDYDVIIFKHCFPGAQVVADEGNPSISSSTKSLENYKLQYRALRSLMDSYPDNKFIVWTLVPLHRLDTNAENAARAREFVDWVKTTWLTEDGLPHPNIYIFDFFGYAAESNSNPENGQLNCLKYEYERSHTDPDSHPNELANQTIGPIFAEFIVNTIEGNTIEPPSVPVGLILTSFSDSVINLSWDASNGNVAVSGYNVYRDGDLIGSTPGTSYADSSVARCSSYSYTVSAFDASGNESAQSAELEVSNCAPDLTPTLMVRPNIAHGTDTLFMYVRVTEVNSEDTEGTITVSIPKDSKWELSDAYVPSLTMLGTIDLDNSNWSYTEDELSHIFTSQTAIPATGSSTFGFILTFFPDSSKGEFHFTAQIAAGGGGEIRVTNNSDVERIDYFQ